MSNTQEHQALLGILQTIGHDVRQNGRKLDKLLGASNDAILKKLDEIEVKLDRFQSSLDSMKEMIMALADDLKAGIQQLNDETNAIGVLITKLASGIKNSMSDQEVADIKGALGTVSDRLTSLAVDPTVPVPPPPPALAALKKK